MLSIFNCSIILLSLCSTNGVDIKTHNYQLTDGYESVEMYNKHIPLPEAKDTIRAISNSDRKATISYTLYPNGNKMAPMSGEPVGISLFCLMCHDGLGASEMHSKNERRGLSNNHPIGIRYDYALASSNASLRDPGSTLTGLGGTIEEDLLEDGYLSCISCHEAPSSINLEYSANNEWIENYSTTHCSKLRLDNQNSELCLICHDV